MSDPTFQTSIYGRRNGSVQTVDNNGTIQVLSGGQISIASGGSIVYAAGAVASFAGTISIGGTAGRWAFGSQALAGGSALVLTGLTQIVSAHASSVGGAGGSGTGGGTATAFQVEPSRFSTGTAFFLGVTGSQSYTGAGTLLWYAMGF